MPVVIEDVVWGAISRVISARCPRPSQESVESAASAGVAESAGSAAVAGSCAAFGAVVSVGSCSSAGASGAYAVRVSSAYEYGLAGRCFRVPRPTSGAVSAGAAAYAVTIHNAGAADAPERCPVAVLASLASSAGTVGSALFVSNSGALNISRVPYTVYASHADSAEMAGSALVVSNSGTSAYARVPYVLQAGYASSALAVPSANYVSNLRTPERVGWAPVVARGSSALHVDYANYVSGTIASRVPFTPSCRIAKSAGYAASCSRAAHIISSFAGLAGAADIAGTLSPSGLASLAVLVSSGGHAVPAGGAQTISGVKEFTDGIVVPYPTGESYACPVRIVRELVSSALAERGLAE